MKISILFILVFCVSNSVFSEIDDYLRTIMVKRGLTVEHLERQDLEAIRNAYSDSDAVSLGMFGSSLRFVVYTACEYSRSLRDLAVFLGRIFEMEHVNLNSKELVEGAKNNSRICNYDFNQAMDHLRMSPPFTRHAISWLIAETSKPNNWFAQQTPRLSSRC